LDPPCEQLNTQVLDITYRVEYEEAALSDTHMSSLSRQSWLGNWLGYWAGSDYGISYFGGIGANWHKPPAKQVGRVADHLGTDIIDDTDYAGAWLDRVDHTRNAMVMDTVLSQTDWGGRIFGCMLYGMTENASPNTTDYLTRSCFVPPLPPDFVNSPVQPVHIHAATATQPFLDVNHLATGTGLLTLNGDGWTDPDYPKYQRYDIYNTGDVGVSTYAFRQRNTVGFSSGTSYSSREDNLGFRHDHKERNDFPTIIGGHGMSTNDDRKMSKFDGRTVICRDTTGITVVDIINGMHNNFDTTTTPPIGGVSVIQTAVDDNKNLWVANGAAGLYKIVDPLGTPTITQMTNVTNGIPIGGETLCMGVAVGAGNTVWALFDGGLSSSSDGGTSWTNYDPGSGHPFSYTNITNDNWHRVVGIVVDVESPVQQMAIVHTFYNVSGWWENHIAWWSTEDTALPGPAIPIYRYYSSAHREGSDMLELACSYTGGMWTWARDYYTNDIYDTETTTILLVYGTTENNQTFGPNTTVSRTTSGLPMIAYDYYGAPYAAASGLIDNVPAMYSIDMKMYNALHGSTDTSSQQASFAMVDADGVGKGLWLRQPNNYDARPMTIRNICPATGLDTLNTRYSPFEEFVWDKYQWNGSDWIKGYHADAVDTSGNLNHATRHNFDVEDYSFTGRSMIDVTPSFATSTFAGTGTLAFTLAPIAKLSASQLLASAQEPHSVVFEINNDGGTNRLMLFWDNDTGNLSLEDGGASVTFPTPVDGGTYRVIVAFDATSAYLYIDGTLVATLTLTATLDFSNPSSTLVAHVGARTHARAFVNNLYNVSNFFRGTMNNVQMWNIAWDQTDVTNDMVDISGVIASKPGANLISRYELTQSLSGLETKPTHVASEATIDGLTNNFTDGATAPAFVAGEYYTVGVVDGLQKDNATTITMRSSIYLASQSDPTFSSFSAHDDTNIVPGVSGTTTERVVFTSYYESSILTQPGEITSDNVSNNGNYGGQSMQTTYGDCSLSFKVNMANMNAAMGFDSIRNTSESSYDPESSVGFKHYFRFYTNGQVSVGYEGNIQASNLTTHAMGDEFRLVRVGSTVTFQKVISGVPTDLYTSGTASSGLLYAQAGVQNPASGFHDILWTYEKDAQVMSCGDSVGGTGAFADDFLAADYPLTLFADGVPLTVVNNIIATANMSEPAAGIVNFNRTSGMLKFNSAQIGAAITGTVVMVTDLPK